MKTLDVLVIGGLIGLVVVCVAAYVWIVQWAWNTFVPAVFHGPTIDLMQAAALAVLLSAISGGTRYVRDR